MSEGPHTNEDDPLSSSLRRSSQKDTRDMTQSIISQAEERACRKKMREDRAHKMPAFGSFQVLKPATLDHSYVPHVCPSIKFRNYLTDDDVMYLESGEEGATNTLLISDCGSDVSVGTETTTFWIATVVHILV